MILLVAMENDRRNNVDVLFLAFLLTFGGIFADALSYDYTATTKCLVDPHKPQYNGGVIINPEINDGLKGWTTYGGVRIESRSSSETGNKFLVAHSRKHSYASVSQKLFLEKEKLYTFSAWIQASGKRSNVPVTAVFRTSEGLKSAGSVLAQAGCWSMLKGGLSVASSGPAQLFFESNDTSIDIWIDSVSLQPFTNEEWRSHQYQSIEKARKANVRLQVTDAKGNPVPFANISLAKNKIGFPFGVAINQNILKNEAYQTWFTPRFTVTTFENEMKWYSTEATQGKEDYSAADAMLTFTSQRNIAVRGHNIFWEDPRYQPGWVNNLNAAQLKEATEKRLNSVVPRYAGKVIAWDVDNENLHFNYYPRKLGENIGATFFQRTKQLDGRTTLFVNDYNTIEDSSDGTSSPSNYLQKLASVRGVVGGRTNIGIGVEGHFGSGPNIAYMRSALDTLASANAPIWITELDVTGSNQAEDLENILREAHAHPAIKGIIIWSAWSPQGCYRMCLTDNNFKNLPTGDVVDKLLAEWGHRQAVVGTTDADGFFNTSLFHGDYEVKLLRQAEEKLVEEELSSFISQKIKVDDHFSEQVIKITAQ